MRTAVCPACGAKRLKWASNALGMRYLVDFDTEVEHYKTCPGVKAKGADAKAPGMPDDETTPDTGAQGDATPEGGESGDERDDEHAGDAGDGEPDASGDTGDEPDDSETGDGDGSGDSGESEGDESGDTGADTGEGEGEPEDGEPEDGGEGDGERKSGDSGESEPDGEPEGDESGDGDGDQGDEPEPKSGDEPKRDERDEQGEDGGDDSETGDDTEGEGDESGEGEGDSKGEDEPSDEQGDESERDEPKAPEDEPTPEPEPERDTNHRLQARLNRYVGIGLNVGLVGPAGGGKTTAARLAAEAHGLRYFEQSVGPQTSQWDLIGFIGPNGEYHPGSLYEPFKSGGLAMLDEVDAGNPGILVVLNSLMANGHYRFPNGEEVTRHPDFRLVAGANTYGRGADRLYVGRNQLDAATLDRFAILEWDYDEAIEATWAGDGSAAWVRYVQQIRKVAFDLQMRFVVSPRASIYGARMLRAGEPVSEVCETVLFKGLARNERAKFEHIRYVPDEPKAPEAPKPDGLGRLERAGDIVWKYRELDERAKGA